METHSVETKQEQLDRPARLQASDKEAEQKLEGFDFPSSDNPMEVRMELVEDLDEEFKSALGTQEHRLVMLDEKTLVLEPKCQQGESSEWLPPFFDG